MGHRTFKNGDAVVFISHEMHMAYPFYYPEPGTLGTVIDADTFMRSVYVRWPAGSTSGEDEWLADINNLMLLEEHDQEQKLFDKPTEREFDSFF